ncbi:hypothetical protein GF314_07420 [bacterium]|nr:hypothetical protein [bacterium]
MRRRPALIAAALLVAGAGLAETTIPIVDTVPTAGSCRAVESHGSVLHAGRGGYLVSTDVADPLQPTLLATTWFGRQVVDVAVFESDGRVLAAVALGPIGLRLVDVTDPTAPERRGELIDREAWRLEWVAPRLYVAAAEGGVLVVDATDPDAPAITGELPVRPAHAPRALASRTGTLYVAALDDSLEAYSLASPDAPTRLGGSRGGNYVDLACNGPVLAALTTDGLELIDVSSFTGLPVLAVWTPPGEDPRPWSVHLDDDRAWVADLAQGLHLVDVSAPAAPVALDLAAWPANQAWTVGRAAGTVALGTVDAGVALVEEDAGTIAELGRVTEPYPSTLPFLGAGAGRAVGASRHRAMLAMPSPPQGAAPGELLVTPDQTIDAAGSDGAVAVLACWMDSYPYTRLWVVDVQDPADPVVLCDQHGLPTGQNSHSQQVEIRDDVLYVTNFGLRTYDLTEIDPVWGPADIGIYGFSHRLGTFALVDDAGVAIWDARYDELRLLQHDQDMQLQIVDVLPVDGEPTAMTAHAGRLYVAMAQQVRIFDVSDPTDAVEIGSVPLATFALEMVADDAGLWLALGADGVERWDVTDPGAAVLAATLTDQGRVDHLELAGGLVLACAPHRGLLWLGDAVTATDDQLARATALAPARPNPFNPRTHLRYEVAHAGLVKLTIHDLRGRLMRTLVDGPHAAGVHTAVWDGRDGRGRALPSGVYVGRLHAGETVRAQRMTLVR